MKEFALQKHEKLLFGKALFEYSSFQIKSNVKNQFAEKVGCTVRSFNDKIHLNSRRNFTEYETDVLISLLRTELGEEFYNARFTAFLAEMSDGDRRALENNAAFQTDVQDREEAAAYGLIL